MPMRQRDTLPHSYKTLTIKKIKVPTSTIQLLLFPITDNKRKVPVVRCSKHSLILNCHQSPTSPFPSYEKKHPILKECLV